MSDVFFEEMQIPRPQYNLHLGSGSHGKMTGSMLSGIEELLLEHKPDSLLVYGDTNSTLAGALAASKLHIPVIHVEAGLRSYMMAMPEEQNRRLTDHLSTWLMCPTQTAVDNLKKEGIVHCGKNPTADNKGVYLTGDIMYEASLFYRKNNKAKIIVFCAVLLLVITVLVSTLTLPNDTPGTSGTTSTTSNSTSTTLNDEHVDENEYAEVFGNLLAESIKEFNEIDFGSIGTK